MDVSKYCRTCLNNNNSVEMLSIYDFIDGILFPDADYNNAPTFAPTTKRAISEMLEAITGNKIISSSLPTKICVKCIDNVKMSFAFQHQCMRSFEILTTMLKDKLLTDPSIEMDMNDLHNIINTPGLLEGNNIQKTQQLNSNFSDRPAEAIKSNHKEIQTDEGLYYECEMCDYKFFDEFSLRHHRTEHPDIKCMICKKTFTRITSLKKHLYVYHKKSYKTGVERECKECKNIFGTNKSFIHHIKLYENCGNNLENVKKAKRITDAKITQQNKIRENEDKCHIIVVQQNAQGKWECKTCGKLYNNESNLRKHICRKSEINTGTSTSAGTAVLSNDKPSILLQNTSNMTIKSSSTRVTRSATRNSITPISDAMNSAIKEEILSDNDVDIEDVTPFEIIFTNELSSIGNIKIKNKNTDDDAAYNKNDLNLNNVGVISADDSIDNYDEDYNPLIKTQQINKINNYSNSSNGFNVEDGDEDDDVDDNVVEDDEDDDDYDDDDAENVGDRILKKKKVKNTKHKDELLAEKQRSNLGEPVLPSTTSTFTKELSSIGNIKIKNENTDDDAAYNKNDLNLNNVGVISADDSIDNYDEDYNPLIKTQQINKINNYSNSSNGFNVEDGDEDDDVDDNVVEDDEDDDDYDDDDAENVGDRILKKKKVKNTKHKDELLAEKQRSNLGEPVLPSTTSNDDFNDERNSETLKMGIESKTIRKKLSTKIKIACDLCAHTFVDFAAFTRHKERHANVKANRKPKNFQCSVCNAAFKKKSLLNRHMYSHSTERPFKCTICKTSFTSPDGLRKHTKTHDEKRLTCSICNIKFDTAIQLTYHKKRVHKVGFVKQNSYVCDICATWFVSFSNIERHMKRHTELQWECKDCKLQFNSYKEKWKHSKSHKFYLCPECGKSFKNRSNYIVHMRRHNGINPFPCKFCKKAFPRLIDLTAHERHHTNFRPHKCTICDKAFTRPCGLKTHMRTHTGERPYKCKFCPNAYAQSNDLKTHIRRHTGERFRCNICDAAFIQNHLLSQHKRKNHGMSIPTLNGRLEKMLPPNDNDQRSITTAAEAESSTLMQSTVSTVPFHLDTIL